MCKRDYETETSEFETNAKLDIVENAKRAGRDENATARTDFEGQHYHFMEKT